MSTENPTPSTTRELLKELAAEVKFLSRSVQATEAKVGEIYKHQHDIKGIDLLKEKFIALEKDVFEIKVVKETIEKTQGGIKASVAFWIGLGSSILALMGTLGALFATGNL